MIPKINDDLKQDFGFKDKPTKTFKFNIGNQTITGLTDNLEAMKQAIYLILNVERYENLIYSWNYGIELQNLYGMDTNYILSELRRRITEALLQDSRITGVTDFSFDTNKGVIYVSFKVATIYGEVQTEKVVNI